MIRLHGAPCSPLDGVTACVVYMADSIRKFDSKSNRTADSIRDLIRTQKKRFAAAYLRRSSYVARKPPRGGSKTQNCRYRGKITFRFKNVCYTVSLCEKYQQQSCRAYIGLTVRAKMIG